VASAAESPQVRIDSGALAGVIAGDVEAFLRIPYASPPAGPLRWRAPQPAPAWHGVRKAAAFGHDCMQEPYPSDAAPLGAQPAEDCLGINLWRPIGTKTGDLLPVLVWIYGGGNVNGGASPAVYSGASFARNQVLFVSVNYRVGRCGFFAFPELMRQDADHGLLANYGYMDALAALHWVQRNISAFGGDPRQVTVHAQSAGAGQVYMLLTSPLAAGLFARAIVQSGGMVDRPPMQAASDGSVSIEAAGVNFAHRWGIEGTGAESVRRLRALSAQQVTPECGSPVSDQADGPGPIIRRTRPLHRWDHERPGPARL
jgi:para-nitrobenzyl esterase